MEENTIPGAVCTVDEWQRLRVAAAHIVQYFTEQKFTVDDARNTLDIAGRLLTAATTVNADETAISAYLGFGQ